MTASGYNLYKKSARDSQGELIEREIDYFSVIEHDGVIFGCAALYPFPAEKMAEMACLTVNPEVQAQGDGERILKHMENRARAIGVQKLFVLTTRTSHWFQKRGFVPTTVDATFGDAATIAIAANSSAIRSNKRDRPDVDRFVP